MKPREIKAARVKIGYTQKYMADKLGITQAAYRNKENGLSPFKDNEKVIVAQILSLSAQEFMDVFFGDELPAGNI